MWIKRLRLIISHSRITSLSRKVPIQLSMVYKVYFYLLTAFSPPSLIFRTYHLLLRPSPDLARSPPIAVPRQLSVRPSLPRHFRRRCRRLRCHESGSREGQKSKRRFVYPSLIAVSCAVQCSFASEEGRSAQPQPCPSVTVPYESDRTRLAARRRPAARLSDR